MFWCTKNVKFHFRWCTKPQTKNERLGMIVMSFQHLKFLGKQISPIVSYFLTNNALLYHFLANWLAHGFVPHRKCNFTFLVRQNREGGGVSRQISGQPRSQGLSCETLGTRLISGLVIATSVRGLSNTPTYYPTALRRVQITLKTSTNITRYLYSRGPVWQVSCRWPIS